MELIKSFIYETQYHRENYNTIPDYLPLYLGGLKSDLFEFTLETTKNYDNIYLEIDKIMFNFRRIGEQKYFLQIHYSKKEIGYHEGKIIGVIGKEEEILKEKIGLEVLCFEINFYSWLSFNKELSILPNHPLTIFIMKERVKWIKIEFDGHSEYFKQEKRNIFKYSYRGWRETGVHYIKIIIMMIDDSLYEENFRILVDYLYLNGGIYPDFPCILKIPVTQKNISFKIPVEGKIKKLKIIYKEKEETFQKNRGGIEGNINIEGLGLGTFPILFSFTEENDTLLLKREVKLIIEPEKANRGFIYSVVMRSLGEANKIGTTDDLRKLLPTLKNMGVDGIYFLPLHPLSEAFKLGNDGSLYAFTDHYQIRPLYVPEDKRGTQEEIKNEFARLFKEIKEKYEMDVIIEMGIHQAGADGIIEKEKPSWLLKKKNGEYELPGPIDRPEEKWPNLRILDWRREDVKEKIFEYIYNLFEFWCQIGVRIFRWDSPHQLPFEICKLLREKLLQKYPDIVFYGETLGCAFGFTEELSKIGFSIYGDLMWWFEPDKYGYEDQLWEYYRYLYSNERKGWINTIQFSGTHDDLSPYLHFYIQKRIKEILGFDVKEAINNLKSPYQTELITKINKAYRLVSKDSIVIRAFYSLHTFITLFSPLVVMHNGHETFNNILGHFSNYIGNFESDLFSIVSYDEERERKESKYFINFISYLNKIKRENKALQEKNFQAIRTGQRGLFAFVKNDTNFENKILVIINMDPEEGKYADFDLYNNYFYIKDGVELLSGKGLNEFGIWNNHIKHYIEPGQIIIFRVEN